MGKYILKRVLLLIPTTFIVCLIVFAMLRCIPGDAVDAMLYKYQSMGNTTALLKRGDKNKIKRMKIEHFFKGYLG